MKKILGIILSVTLCLNIFAGMSIYAVEEEMQTESVVLSESTKEAIEILRLFEIFPDYYDYNVKADNLTTRADFANAVAKLIKCDQYTEGKAYFYDVPQTHWAYSGIGALTELGIIDGVGNSLFRPDDPIAMTEAYKMLIAVLGYTQYAEGNGGYPIGYTLIARRIGLLKNVHTDMEYVTMDNMFVLLYNAMVTELLEPIVYGTYEKQYDVSDQTLLSIYHDVYYKEGVVEAVNGINLNNQNIDDDKVVIDSIEYDTEIDLTDLLGLKIKMFYRNDTTSDTKTILWAKENGKNDFLDIVVDNDASFNKETFILNYYDAKSDKNRTVTLNRKMKVVYNGVGLSENIDKAFNESRYKVRLIGESGAYSTAIIKAYKNFVVAEKASDDYLIYDRLTGNKLSLNKNDYRVIHIKNTNGVSVDFSTIQTNNVLSVYLSVDKEYIEVIVCDNEVSGKVDTIMTQGNGSYITINGQEYYINSKALEFSVGDTLNIYLDVNDEIAYYKIFSSKAFAGYMMRAAFEENGLEPALRIKVLGENGNIEVYDCSSKITVDGIRYKDIKSAYSALCKSGGFVRQLALFEINKDGELKNIDTSSYNMENESSGSLQVNVARTATTFKTIGINGVGVLGVFGVMNSNSIIFSVPNDSDEDSAEDKDYRVLKLNSFINDSPVVIETYKSKEDAGVEEYVVVRGYTPPSSYNTPVLVTDKGTKLNDEGQVVDYIEGFSRTSVVSYIAPENVSLANLNPGMVIKPIFNVDNELTGANIIYDYRNHDEYKSVSDANANLRPVIGYVNDVVDDVIKVGYTDPSVIDQIMYMKNVPVLVYDTKTDRNNIKIGNVNDAITYKNGKNDCSKIVAITNHYAPYLFVIFN